jgi:thymidylate synthase (FAD)
MRVIPASFEIMEDLDRQSLITRIEACGRICYKSEDKISQDSAGPFVKGIIKHGHNSVMEMGVFTLKVAVANDEDVTRLYGTIPKYLFIDRMADHLLLTASVRAFRELIMFHGKEKIVAAIGDFLLARHPLMYEDLASAYSAGTASDVQVEKVGLPEVDQFKNNLLARHRHIAVKFFVNRAITHEIVRHRPCSYLQESQRYCRYSQSKFDSQVTFIKPMFFDENSEEYRLWEKAMLATEEIYLKLLATVSPQAARTVLPNSCKTELIAYANLVEWHHIFKLRTSAGAEPSMREIMSPLLARFQQRFPGIFEDLGSGNKP